ncbi:hypothetical protein P171DRAFT_470657 [Karstenula rhodostoma CBS 690.94]|uniref:Uncharacterized protein n=1 Tax=Karstenula rhodostoma CBS 690.94 TaxID=1392251 RepID=A0A9P4UHA7_9PLEO|nr:hypothetical protein P171DRAFT_470657 [Karstenula rhodostoma CBS 690.94]
MAMTPLQQIGMELGLGLAFTMIALAPMLKQERNPLPSMRVEIVIGLPGDDKSEGNMGGAIPNVALFDANGDRLGFSRNLADTRNLNKDNQKSVPEGAVMNGGTAQLDVGYLTEGDSGKPEYITVSASGFDAVCIMEVVVKHPFSDDHFAFLPGEVAKQCTAGWEDGDTVYWSEQSTQLTFEVNGEQARSRPKCLWIDTPNAAYGDPITKWTGFGVHLPDFAVDNYTFVDWENDPWQMCGSKARFGLYEKINEMMCPPVFTKAPNNGARLPMEEYPSCSPFLVPDASGNIYEDFCDDPNINEDELAKLSEISHHSCETKEERVEKFQKTPGTGCKRDPALGRRVCPKKRAAKERGIPKIEKLQSRFHGQLVKSYDIGQSARTLCYSKGSVGPNFYSYHEESFCDMSKKKLYPLCKEEDATECFDVSLNETRHGLETRGKAVKHTSVAEWW